MDRKHYLNLEGFLENWSLDYSEKMSKIDLFDDETTSNWSRMQQQEFVKVFYHARGHFHDFLWYLANHSTDKRVKEIVLKNIKEELNGSSKSHEQLYLEFASEFDIDLKYELIEGRFYIPFIKEFNKGHLEWLANEEEEARICAFSAYEKLDNIDYIFLLKLAKNIKTSRKGLTFFKIHTKVEHFESTVELIDQIWRSFPEKVIGAFNFITGHQLNLWNRISLYINNL